MQSTEAPRAIDILGTRIHDVTMAEALAVLVGFIERGGAHRVVTPNPEFAIAARRDPEFRRIVNASDLAIPDGIGLLLAASMLGTKLRAHVRGTDLVLRLAARSAHEGWRWFCWARSRASHGRAGENLKAQFFGTPDCRHAFQLATCR